MAQQAQRAQTLADAGAFFTSNIDPVWATQAIAERTAEVLGDWAAVDRALVKALPILCAYQVGACQEIFEMTNEYTRTRIVFGQPMFRNVLNIAVRVVIQVPNDVDVRHAGGAPSRDRARPAGPWPVLAARGLRASRRPAT